MKQRFLCQRQNRPSEIPELIKLFAKTMLREPYEVSKSAVEVLSSALWKDGNIRELRNCLRAMTEGRLDKLLTPHGDSCKDLG